MVVCSLNNSNFFVISSTSEPELRNCIEAHRNYFKDIANHMLLIEPLVGKIKLKDIEMSAYELLYNSFAAEYQPLKTPPDGNCLWHMVSLCLVGNTTLMYILRALTTFTILNMKNEIFNFLRWEFETTRSVYEEEDLKKYLNTEYDEMLKSSRCLGHFGNQYHLLIISTFLQRNIFIYSRFPDKLCFRKLDFKSLHKSFNNACNNFGLHLKYTPIKNHLFNLSLPQKTIYGFYNMEGKHYSAIVPAKKDLIEFIPRSEWFGF
jgi:hypothetical protein